MLRVLLLVCSLSYSPSECQPQTAINIVQGPYVESELLCGLHGQAYMANADVLIQPGEYLKIICTRER